MIRPFLVIMLIFLVLCRPANAILDTIQISNLTDFNLPSWNLGDGDVNASINICIYALGVPTLNTYAVRASSPDGFVLVNGSHQIPYTLSWEDSGGGNLGSNSGTTLTNNVKLTNRNNANILSSNCSLGGNNARLYLKITQAAMTAALAGTYTGTITLLISPT
jgi:hypothetical protein